jgi:plastocyanin domain-containing protein
VRDVDIEFTPEKPGDIAFACGMEMLPHHAIAGTMVN